MFINKLVIYTCTIINQGLINLLLQVTVVCDTYAKFPNGLVKIIKNKVADD